MRRVKSRNFILIVCGVLLALVISFSLSRVLLSTINGNNTEDNYLNKIVFSSTKVETIGGGNFLVSTPVIDNLSVLNFNVRLSSLGDRVKYIAKYCNMNSDALIYKGISAGEVLCNEPFWGKNTCENIIIRSYVLNGNKELKINEKIAASSCYYFVIDALYDGIDSKTINVLVDEYTLKLEN